MRVYYCSDLHNDYNGANDLLNLKGDKNAVLVVAGDVNSGGRMVRDLEEVADRWLAIVAVPGNHDYWGLAIDRKDKLVSEKENVHILIDDYKVINGTLFAGTTLWHEVTAQTGHMWKSMMNDERRIRGYNYSRLKGWDIHNEHLNGLRFIEDIKRVFKDSDIPKILVTHHALSEQSIDERYQGHATNVFYVTHKPEMLDGFDYHIHGHVHQEFNYMENGCNVLCNPRAYSYENPEYGIRLFDTKDKVKGK